MNEIVRTLLDAVTLPASDDEIAAYAAGFADQRAAVDALYVLPEVRYAAPALHFRAASRIVDWAS